MEKAINMHSPWTTPTLVGVEANSDALAPATIMFQARQSIAHQYKLKRSLCFSLLLHAALLAVVAWFAHKAPLPVIRDMPITVSLVSKVADAPIVDNQSEPVQKSITPEPQRTKQPLPLQKQPQVAEPLPVSPVVTDTSSPVAAVTPVASKPTQESVAESKPVETSAKVAPEKPTPQEEVTEPPKFGVAYLNNPKPKYPRLSKSAGEEGRVLFKVLVNENGDAESVEIATSSGFERLDDAAMEAVRQWKFVPAKRNNQPMSAYVTVPISFKLD